MANAYDPRLTSFSSTTSSENDSGDVFMGKAAFQFQGAVRQRGGFALGKMNRFLSEPGNGSTGKKADESKLVGRAPALSDSSNFIKRGGGIGGTGIKPSSEMMKTSPECDGSLKGGRTPNSDVSDSGSNDSVFPEPEHLRKLAKNTHFSVLLEEDDNILSGDEGITFNAGNRQVETFENEFVDTLNEDSLGGSLNFEDSRNIRETTLVAPSDYMSGNLPGTDEDDDSLYPEIEHFSSNYKHSPYDDFSFSSIFSQANEPQFVVRRSFDAIDSFPELPDDLFKNDLPCPEMDVELEAVDIPELAPLKCYAFE